MRPYRAKKRGTKEWVYGWLTYDPVKTGFEIKVVEDIPPTQNEPGGDFYCETFEIDTSTVCQQIGLQDKEGNEIYEKDAVTTSNRGLANKGDIMFIRYSGTRHVLYNPNCCKHCKEGFGHICEVDEFGGYTIIGNTIDNPELM